MNYYELAREMAESSTVLLENKNGVLPLERGQSVAVFGRTQTETIYSGNGSGAVDADRACNILEACERTGLCPEEGLADFYRNLGKPTDADGLDWSDMAAMAKLVHSGAIYEYFGQYRPTLKEAVVPEELVSHAVKKTDTAIYVLGRSAGGEECDRHMENDYYLSDEEKALVEQICSAFSKVILVLNINGVIDLGWLKRYLAVQSILFLGIPGEAGAEALLRVIVGEVSPSGRLAFTIPACYEDYPCAEHFSWDKEELSVIKSYADYGLDAQKNGSNGFTLSPVTVYREGLYNGYRFFDTFQVAPLYPFGHGLSYTEFMYGVPEIHKTGEGMELKVAVTNTGRCAGRDVVQIYVDTRRSLGEAPAHTLQGFAKTGLLMQGASETVRVFVPWQGFARYDEKDAAWIIPQGLYGLCIGEDACHMRQIATVSVPQKILIEQDSNLLGIHSLNRDKISFLRNDKVLCETGILNEKADFTLYPADVESRVLQKKQNVSELSDFSVEELAALCVGYGPGTPFSAFGDQEEPSTIADADGRALAVNDHPAGMPGYVSPAMPERNIHSVSYKDGPAGIGGTAWPSEMLLACSFDEDLCVSFGDAVGNECESQGVDVWLAPAVNLHRHPLCGRNFEYFSEDPFLTGRLACAVARGVQEKHSVLVCPKHFAANEQETFRRGNARLHIDAVDSILEERTLRELYLRPFEMLVRSGHIHCMMTSFNKINGTFTAGNAALCTGILREEWGFDGAVVTDWGDMDTVADGADAVAAGNDIVMPGGPPVIRQILKGVKEGRINRGQLETAVGHLLDMLRFL